MLWMTGRLYSPDEFYTPVISIECIKCDDEDCNSVHGWGIVFRLMWWGCFAAVMFGIEEE